MVLNDLFPEAYIENTELECKAMLNREKTLSWLKTVNGFANGKGGTLYLGVEDKTLKLIGFDKASADKEKLFFHNELSLHMAILPTYEIEQIAYQVKGKARFILRVHVFEASKKPLILRYEGMPMIFLRRDGFTNPASEEEIRMMVLSSARPSFDSSLTDIDYDPNDFKAYSDFFKERTGREIRLKDLESIGFVEKGKLTNGANLFRDSYDGGRTRVACNLHQGITRGGDTLISSNSFSGNLIDSYRFISEFVQMRMNRAFVKKGDRRENIDAFPTRALFEAIINALAHRDYFLDDTEISVDLFANRLSISSPGSLFEGSGNLPPTHDLSSFASKRRNEVIAGAFVLANAMEAKGTGLEKIMADYSAFDKKHQPFVYSKNNAFFIVLPDLTNPDGVEIEDDSIVLLKKVENPTRFDVSILSFCFLNEKSSREITEHLGLSNSSFFKKAILDNLLSQGFLISGKRGNATVYRTNEEFVKTR